MSPREIDDVKKVKNGVGQHTCQVLRSKYYSFRNYDGGGGGIRPPGTINPSKARY